MPQSPVWTLTTTEWLDHIWCDMSQRDTRTLHTHRRKVLLHLLKWRYQPWQRFEGHSWLDTILNQSARDSYSKLFVKPVWRQRNHASLSRLSV